jgi:hypothetical protein
MAGIRFNLCLQILILIFINIDLLWADPIKENGRQPSKRGISVGFGPDVA